MMSLLPWLLLGVIAGVWCWGRIREYWKAIWRDPF